MAKTFKHRGSKPEKPKKVDARRVRRQQRESKRNYI